PLPPAVLLATLASAPELDQAVAFEAPIDRGPGRDGLETRPGQVVLDPPGSPAGVLPAELADRGLHLSPRLVGAGAGPVGPVRQGAQTSGLVPGDPGVDGLPGDPEAPGHLDDLPPLLDHRQYRLVPLFHDTQLHQHGPPPRLGTGKEMGMCQASAGATVKDQAESVSGISRTSVKHQVTPERRASPEARHACVGREAIEPSTRGFKAPCSSTALPALAR